MWEGILFFVSGAAIGFIGFTVGSFSARRNKSWNAPDLIKAIGDNEKQTHFSYAADPVESYMWHGATGTGAQILYPNQREEILKAKPDATLDDIIV